MKTKEENIRKHLINQFLELLKGKDLTSEEMKYGVGIIVIALDITQRRWKQFVGEFPLEGVESKDRPDLRKFTFLADVLFWFKQRDQFGDADFHEMFECLEEFQNSCVDEHYWIQYRCQEAFNMLYPYPKRVPELMLRLGFEGYVRGYCQDEDSRKNCPSGDVFDRLQKIVPDLAGAPVDGLANVDLDKVRRNLSNRDNQVREFFGPEGQQLCDLLREQVFSKALTLHELKKVDGRMLKPAKSPSGLGLRLAYFDSVKDRRS